MRFTRITSPTFGSSNRRKKKKMKEEGKVIPYYFNLVGHDFFLANIYLEQSDNNSIETDYWKKFAYKNWS